VNVTIDPTLKKSVLDGSLVKFRCVSCGDVSILAYDLLYHDMDRGLLIWLKYPDEDGSSRSVEAPEMNFGGENGYIHRTVRYYPELVEKILLADEGLDDWTIEFVKLEFSLKLGFDLADPFLFSGTTRSFSRGKLLVFERLVQGKSMEFEVPMSHIRDAHFQKLIQRFQSIRQRDRGWPYVGREAVLAVWEGAGWIQARE
jgi:hypothetical protein